MLVRKRQGNFASVWSRFFLPEHRVQESGLEGRFVCLRAEIFDRKGEVQVISVIFRVGDIIARSSRCGLSLRFIPQQSQHDTF